MASIDVVMERETGRFVFGIPLSIRNRKYERVTDNALDFSEGSSRLADMLENLEHGRRPKTLVCERKRFYGSNDNPTHGPGRDGGRSENINPCCVTTRVVVGRNVASARAANVQTGIGDVLEGRLQSVGIEVHSETARVTRHTKNVKVCRAANGFRSHGITAEF